jgi:hypothetical protein
MCQIHHPLCRATSTRPVRNRLEKIAVSAPLGPPTGMRLKAHPPVLAVFWNCALTAETSVRTLASHAIMNRRIFFTLVFATLSLLLSREVGAADNSGRQYYELRIYTTKSEKQQNLISDYWEKAGVPAYNRIGAKPIGVFTPLEASETNKVYVLIPFDSFDAIAAAPQKLAADSAYQAAAKEFMLPKNDALYQKLESSVLVAFEGMKHLQVPSSTAEKKPWVFELRTYVSPNEERGNNKVAMFNAGEIEVMKEVGLSPVFFSQTLVGSPMPSLTYMVSSENKDEHKKHFGGFGSHPTWKKLSGDPQYKDNVSSIISVFLKRMPASQI